MAQLRQTGNTTTPTVQLRGTKAHNPFVNQIGVFALTGVPTHATVGDVIFSFGTDAGTGNVPGNEVPPPPVPEPASLILFGTGLLGVGARLRRRPKK